MVRTGCLAALDVEWWSEAILNRLARRTRWSPVAQHVAIAFDESGDLALMGTVRQGTIRACDVADDGTPRDLLIELDQDLHFAAHVTRPNIRWLVTRPCLRWRRTTRLILGWSAVRIIDAPSFRDATYDRTLATGRVHLL
jgi:hypothetical protein